MSNPELPRQKLSVLWLVWMTPACTSGSWVSYHSTLLGSQSLKVVRAPQSAKYFTDYHPITDLTILSTISNTHDESSLLNLLIESETPSLTGLFRVHAVHHWPAGSSTLTLSDTWRSPALGRLCSQESLVSSLHVQECEQPSLSWSIFLP